MQFAMERLLADSNLDWRFISFNVQPDQIREAILGAEALGIAGLAIASPFQAKVGQWTDTISPSATAAGWVDCVSRNSEGLHGSNVIGNVTAQLCISESESEQKAVVVGAGPRSKAVAEEFISRGMPTSVMNPLEGGKIPKDTAIVVVAEEDPDPVRWWLESDTENATLATLALDPYHLGDCHGVRLITGLDILTESIASYFEGWTEHRANRSIIREACEEYFEL